MHISDQELLATYHRDGNAEWLGHLLERYTVTLLGVGMKYLKNQEDARDAVQHVFLTALAEIEKKYPILNFGGWLYRMMMNRCISILRERKYDIDDFSINNIESDVNLNEAWHWEKIKQIDYLNDALNELKNEQKICIQLFYLQKQSYQQIADSTGFEVKEVKSHIQNAKRNLRIKLATIKQ